jgi:ribosome-binding factor A
MRKTEPTEGRVVRLLRVGEQVRHILSEILARGDVHDDVLKHATVFVKPLLGREEDAVLKALRTNTAYLQREVAGRIGLKYAAKLKFLLDESFDEGSHIDTLLRHPKVAQDLGDDTSR